MQLQQKLKVTVSPQLGKILMEVVAAAALGAVARAIMPNGMSPFAPAVAAAVFVCNLPVSAQIGVVAGAALTGSWVSVVACLLTIASLWVFKTITGSINRAKAAMLLIGVNVFVNLITAPQTWLDLISCAINVFATLLLYWVFSLGLKTMTTLRARKLLSEEEALSLSILAGSAVMGIADIEFLGFVPAVILASTAAMVMAQLGGVGLGAAIGVTMGLMLSLGSQLEYALYIAIIGLVGGCVQRLGVYGVISGAILSSMALWLYNKSGINVMGNIVAASALYLVIPQTWKSEIGRFVSASLQREHNRREYLDRLRKITGERMENFAKVFAEMGEIFSAPVSQPKPHDWEVDALMPVCQGCGALNRCWCDKQRLQAAMEAKIMGQEVPFFLQRCGRLDRLSQIADYLIKARDNELDLLSRLQSTTVLAGKQLVGVSSVVNSLAQKLEKDIRFDDELEAILMKRLDQCGISAKDVSAQYASGKLTVTVEGRFCALQCQGKALGIINNSANVKMRLANKECNNMCRFTLEQAMQVEIESAISAHSKDEVCGDSAVAQSIVGGKYLLCISDGMGSGIEAHEESTAAVGLLNRLYSAGVDRDVAVEAVNRLLLLRGTDEMYSTLDVCSIDLISGHAELCKLGAPPSYWINAEGIRRLTAQTLPAGILDRADPQVFAFELKTGDRLVMLSDGAHDCLVDPMQEISRYSTSSPQTAADCLLSIAKQNGLCDDATVIVAQVC